MKTVLAAAIALAVGGNAAPAPQITESPLAGPEPPVRSSVFDGPTAHGAFSGEATTTGALSKPALAPSIAPLPPLPVTYTNNNGELQAPVMPVPYQPAGGIGTNGTEPYYHPLSDFDYESFVVALYQEWIELDLFHDGLAKFSEQDFTDAGLTAEDRSLIEFMANQEVGHATLLSNILGPAAPPQCTYNYPYTTVREFLDFCQKLTRFGESGVYGFLGHLDSQAAATLLLQSISTEARQQMIFRQFDGLHPMPVWFEVGIPQSWAWTLLAPYISSCPANTTRVAWQNFPALTVLNQPNPAKLNPNLGPDQAATGSNPLNATTRSPLADAPRYAMFVSQLNATYVPLVNITESGASAVQPNMSTFAGDPAVNGTIFISITSQNPYLTPYNLSMINPFVYAGPALYQAG
ncbi:Protein rds1 [Cyphellophora attinorum]|uniref:Protein rds1 n=1 Tax=Cyphellophora attinorum TaxID=1664694 RepID=A0A0N1P2L1_9EURO|nr:Protein rds1 [Phialophora attinorum]KPI43857.1 Protein rds1 [Phialophora attinorum]